MTVREQRRGERIQPFLAPCRVIHDGRRFAAHLIELSLGGGRVACRATPPPAGASVLLEVRFETGAPRTRLAAEVRWARRLPDSEDGHMFGVTFAHAEEGGEHSVAEAIEQFRLRAATLS
ncbi:MAG: PilZ domain-containing protein [Vicinamibacteria bacterium]